jgi:hypothetical protein
MYLPSQWKKPKDNHLYYKNSIKINKKKITEVQAKGYEITVHRRKNV